MRTLCAALLAAALLTAAPARARLLNGVDATSGIVPAEPAVGTLLGALLTDALPSGPLVAGQDAVKASAGWLHFRRSIPTDGSGGAGGTSNGAFSETQDGGGASASYLHAFGPHWAVSVVAVGVSAHGTMTKRTAYVADASGPVRDRGAAVGVGAVYEPFGAPDGFRLPITVGLLAASASGKRGPAPFFFPIGTGSGLDGHRGTIEETYSKTVPGGYFGFAPQKEWGPVRTTLYALVARAGSPDNEYVEKDLDTGAVGASKTSSGSIAAATAALELDYVPWDLALRVVLPVSRGRDSGTATGALVSWTRRW